jgi:hypothetical protein
MVKFAFPEVVTIYQDPVTKKKPEGDARVLGIVKENDLFVFVKVRFIPHVLGDPDVIRKILKKDFYR